ncbi:hypothetical protein GCM10027612_63580 [Microbispora bryophytorum subsp. camponoti]
MTTERTVKTPTRNRRAEILEAAAGLFAARGFHGVSIEDIGAAVGISGPALYRHFSGKEALLTEMLLDISERLREQGHGWPPPPTPTPRTRRSTRCCRGTSSSR